MTAAGQLTRARVSARRTERGSAKHKLGVLLVALILGTAVGTSLGWLPGRPDPSSGSARKNPPALVPGVSLRAAAVPHPVMGDASGRSRLDLRALRRLLSDAVASHALGFHVEVVVGPLGGPGPMLQLGANDAVMPASLLKLLTLTAALEVLGPQHRFETSVVQGHRKSDVVLVGGGDPLLTAQPLRPATSLYPYPAPTGLTSLASRTAERLRAQGVGRVRLRYDTSLFAGPAFNPAWRRSYRRDDVVSPISPLWLDEGRAKPGQARRVGDAAAPAARRFADLLRARGVAVARVITRTSSRPDAPTLAHVRSAPLSALVQHVVELSDNEGAEVLLRQVALATGHVGSARAGVRAVTATLTDLGLDLSEVTAYDGSGLSRSDAVPLRVLADVLRLSASPAHPELHPLISALPVAGFTGSLAYRFTRDARAGRGVVRAKTGTLTGVHGLAGVVSTADGQQLVFAAVADEVPVRRTLAARAQLDHIATLLASCGCSR